MPSILHLLIYHVVSLASQGNICISISNHLHVFAEENLVSLCRLHPVRSGDESSPFLSLNVCNERCSTQISTWIKCKKGDFSSAFEAVFEMKQSFHVTATEPQCSNVSSFISFSVCFIPHSPVKHIPDHVLSVLI